MKKMIFLAGALALASVSLSAAGCPSCKMKQNQGRYNNRPVQYSQGGDRYNNRPVQYNQGGDRYNNRPVQYNQGGDRGEMFLDVSDQFITPVDKEILIGIRSKLQGNGLSGENSGIRISVNRGRVLVNGRVSSDSQREQIEGFILNVDGVKEVTSDVYIERAGSQRNPNRATFKNNNYREQQIAAADLKKPTTTSTRQTIISDAEIEKTINDTIKGSWFSKSFPNVRATVNNGNVTLSGFVKTEQDRKTLETKVKNLPGVKGFSSRLTVEDTQPTSTRAQKQSTRY